MPASRPIVVAKVSDQGTPEVEDDLILPGATFEFRLDDGDADTSPKTMTLRSSKPSWPRTGSPCSSHLGRDSTG